MLRFLLPWVVAGAVAALGAFAGWGADRYAASAVLLHAEPALLVLAVWGIALSRWRGRLGLAIGLAAGTIAAVAAVRIPVAVGPPGGAPPDWMGPVSRCAAALNPPTQPVRLLQWTLDGGEDIDTIAAVVAAAEPDVVVLHGVTDTSVANVVANLVGGESRLHGAVDGAVFIAASGGFHPCGDALEWNEGMGERDGYTLSFVGVPPSTVFPLLVARFPGPLQSDWSRRMDAATGRVFDVLGGLQGASAVVVADAPATRTYRTLDGRMAALGLGSVPLPPSWPARLGPLPLLTLHPYGRMWAGPAWNIGQTSRVDAPRGAHAPVLAVLEGPRDSAETPAERLDDAPLE